MLPPTRSRVGATTSCSCRPGTRAGRAGTAGPRTPWTGSWWPACGSRPRTACPRKGPPRERKTGAPSRSGDGRSSPSCWVRRPPSGSGPGRPPGTPTPRVAWPGPCSTRCSGWAVCSRWSMTRRWRTS
ncbi:hypothetical protein [Ornithinimicrobium kibberense]|uniref:hypothetical protein n=1 Tax=Ornithinimicrobium kibberense TaxID=282060 RepID=UPI003617E6AB